MWRLYSICFWIFMILNCFVLFLGALLVFAATCLVDPSRRVLHLYSCFWAQTIFYCNPLWRLRVEGRHLLPKRSAAVLVSNHESLGDILVLFGLYRPFKWVSKASVFRVPLIGWNMSLNRYIPLVRGSRASVMQMMDTCRYWLRNRTPVLFFPEGTRSRDGQLLPFRDGAFKLAVEENCPVYPIVVSGTADILPKNGLVLRGFPRCRVKVLAPVDPARFHGNVEALREHVRDVMARERAGISHDRLDSAVKKRVPGTGR